MIDLSIVARILDEDIMDLIDSLDGATLADPAPLPSDKVEKDAVRALKAQVSRDLLMLSDRLALCEQLVRNQYWAYKSEPLSVDL